LGAVTNLIETIALKKTYHTPGREIAALDGLDLAVAQGEFFGLLGPNGAGKTTTIGILTTRLRPTSGRAVIGGFDVVHQANEVKRQIGVVPQRPNPDRGLRILENLVFHAAYFGIPMSVATQRAKELLERFELGDRADGKVDQLSGGQQQRLMIARALMHQPEVIFLDEPTAGLDPHSRHAVWDLLRELQAGGRTIVMTTHYLEEADMLCDRIAIVDHGKLLACDTPDALKAKAPGGALIELSVDGDANLLLAANNGVFSKAEVQGNNLRAYTERVGDAVQILFRNAAEAGLNVKDVHIAEPSLETLFISMTGRKID
jgi:ABC-2 type transport system ATP-binding protein